MMLIPHYISNSTFFVLVWWLHWKYRHFVCFRYINCW